MKRLTAMMTGVLTTPALFLGGAAFAQGAENHAVDGEVDMLPASSALAEQVHFFHNWILMPIITAISLFVLALLLIVVFKFNSKANPVAKQFSHNTLLEVLWTGIPIIILLVIALFSFDLLFKEDTIPDGKRIVAEADGATTAFEFPNNFGSERRRVTRGEHIHVSLNAGGETVRLPSGAYKLSGLGDEVVTVTLDEAPRAGAQVVIDGGRSVVGPCGFVCLVFGQASPDQEIALAPTMTLKVVGYQWGWTYAYPDFGDFEFSANMLPEDQTTPGLYRLATDNPVVLPVGETIRVTTTARDVIHSWAMPNFAVKIDAVPGRFNETWIKADAPGTYYGQCSEICGVKHAFMPIEVKAVPRDEFERWVDEQRVASGMEPMFAPRAVAQIDAGAVAMNETPAAPAAN